MRYHLIARFVNLIIFFLNLLFSVYLVVSIFRGEISASKEGTGVMMNGAIYLFSALVFIWNRRKSGHRLEHINIKEAILMVGLTWLVMIVMGSLPYLLIGQKLASAIFESTSGFSTTGSTIFSDVEQLPDSLLLWRAGTQWIGGMGIIVFFVSVFPSLRRAGAMLFRSEMPGPVKETFTPHIRDTSRLLWSIYLGLTLVLILALVALDLSWFDAVIHAFTTLSTGGFSSNNASVSIYSPSAQWLICFFMLLGGTNFAVYILMLSPQRMRALNDTEGRWYVGFLFIAGLVVGLSLFFMEGYGLEESLRIGFFTMVSLVTTTGHSNFDYELFPMFLQGIILLAFFTGGSAGSTSGGVKFYRIVLLYKAISHEIKKSISPNLITSVKISGVILSHELMFRVFVFMAIYLLTVGIGFIFFVMMGIDFLTAFTASASFVGNIGPGFGSVGPTENFSHFPDLTQWAASILMILGRLEFFTVISLFHHQFWREN